jgi:hypothetical protein
MDEKDGACKNICEPHLPNYILKSLKTTAKTTDNSGIILTFAAQLKIINDED